MGLPEFVMDSEMNQSLCCAKSRTMSSYGCKISGKCDRGKGFCSQGIIHSAVSPSTVLYFSCQPFLFQLIHPE